MKRWLSLTTATALVLGGGVASAAEQEAAASPTETATPSGGVAPNGTATDAAAATATPADTTTAERKPPFTDRRALGAGRWELSLGAGLGAADWHFVFFGYSPRAAPRVSASAIYALDERLQLRLPLPAAQYRLRLGPGLALIPHGGVQAFSVFDEHWLFQIPRDAVAILPPRAETPVTPRLSLGAGVAFELADHWRAWTFTARGSTTLAFASGPASLRYSSADVGAGLTALLGDRVTLHVAAVVTNNASLPRNLIFAPPMLALGSVQQIGLRRPPLLAVRITEALSVDLTAGAWLGINGHAEALLGLTWSP